jgi:hypothetical protein
MMPNVSRSGVRLAASSSGTFVFWLKARAAFSKRDREPYPLTGAPSARGSAAVLDFEVHATSAELQAALSFKNHRRERTGCMGRIMRYDVCLSHQQETKQWTPPTWWCAARARTISRTSI